MDRVRIGADDAGQRLDRFLRKYLKGAPLTTIYKMIRTRQVEVNGKRAKPEDRLAAGDEVVLHPADRRMRDLRGKPRPSAGAGGRGGRAAGQAPPLVVLYEDEHVLAVAKPPFLIVHEGRNEGEPTLMDLVEAYLPPPTAKTFRPNLAHRIDRLTSGVVLIGKTAEGLRGLTRALRQKKVEKVYLVLVRGEVADDAGVIEAPIARVDLFESDRARVEVEAGGKPARTTFRVRARHRGLTLLEARPQTGRTHQIRAHFAHLGHPVAGDPVYGDHALNQALRGRHGLWRQWLHAYSIAFVHPATGRRIEIRAPLPEDLRRVLDGEGFPAGALPDAAGPASAGLAPEGGGA